jgi:hypothetical protein
LNADIAEFMNAPKSQEYRVDIDSARAEYDEEFIMY